METIIRKFDEFNLKDFYEIMKIREEVFIVEQTCPYQECDGKDQDAFHLLLMEGDCIMAYLRILKKGVSYDEISIGRVLVRKKYRGRGLAKTLMKEAINFIEDGLNETHIRISAQEYLISFYEKCGFEAVSDMYLEDNIPHVEMLYKKESSHFYRNSQNDETKY